MNAAIERLSQPDSQAVLQSLIGEHDANAIISAAADHHRGLLAADQTAAVFEEHHSALNAALRELKNPDEDTLSISQAVSTFTDALKELHELPHLLQKWEEAEKRRKAQTRVTSGGIYLP